jgi:cobalt-zinc-cadmium efflux system membrane fusion protein
MIPFFKTRCAVTAFLAAISLCACGPSCPVEPSAEHGADVAATSFERGPHRGRMLREGGFALELQIFEEGVPPEFHVYLYRDDKLVMPSGVLVTVELHRLDGEVNRIGFAPQEDYLRGDMVVHEPHSFSVVVTATDGSSRHEWKYDSFEGRTTIPAATAASAGVRTEVAGPATIADVLSLRGRLVPNAERVRSVSGRFPGPIRSVMRSVGDNVLAGEALAVVESNESLTPYEVTSPIDGTIVERHANPGETAGNEPLFVVADYRSLWAELTLFPRDLPKVKPGQRVQLRAADGELAAEGRVLRVAPADDVASGPRGLYAVRVALQDAERRWAPGLFVEGTVHVSTELVPLAVKRTGLQGFRDFTVVFAQVGATYEVRMLELGRQDDTWAEVLGGLKPGTPYVAENSYLIKADIEKSAASHDH